MTATRIHLVLALVMGFSGVLLLALGAHGPNAGNAVTAGQMLLFHAPSVLGATLARRAGYLHDILARIALSVLMTGVALFTADLVLRAFAEIRLFPGAAPFGGLMMLGGWSGLIVSALVVKRS